MVAPIKGIPMPGIVVSLEDAARNVAVPPDIRKKIKKKPSAAKGQAKGKGDNGAEGRSNLVNLTSQPGTQRKI